MKFIKIFSIESKAMIFAKQCGGTIQIKYDWDSEKNKMIKMYIVKY